MARRSVVCVFAHPDDEAFGPSGTIYKLSKTHNVYILCATKGQAGQDSSSDASISLTYKRALEIKKSSHILGVKKVYFLGFKDGTLCNNLYYKLAEKIRFYLEFLKPEIVMTYEPRGISGHIDHITVCMVTTFVVRKLNFVSELWYYCIKKADEKFMEDYFIYFPPGYTYREIDKTVDISDVWNIKLKAIGCHKSQRHDAKKILGAIRSLPKKEHFLVRSL